MTLRFVSPASFWTPEYLCESGWIEHAPFAFWICDALRPRRFVELGTHHGYSYFAVCQAIERLALDTVAYAVDSWKGDEHAGFYGDDVFEAVCEHNTKYGAFSRLIRTTFDDAVQYFEDKSVDLLHVDGRHFYRDVKHDFESWRQKLADHAIVLFHDTDVRERGFGVWKFFEELSKSHPVFQFAHGYGLGVLAIGETPAALAPLFQSSMEETRQIRAAYAALGGALSLRVAQKKLGLHLAQRDAHIAEQRAWLSEKDAQLAQRDARLAEQSTELSEKDARLAEHNAHLAEKDRLIAEQQAQLEKKNAHLAEQNAHLAEQSAQLAQRDARLAEQETRIAEQYAELNEKDAGLAEAAMQLSEQRAQVAEYLYHLERINAWGWFKFGIFLDRIARAPFRLVAKLRSGASERSQMAVRPDLSEQSDITPRPSVSEASQISESEDPKIRFRKQSAEGLTAFLAGDQRIRLATSKAPEVSIILVLFNGAELTFNCLRSLETAIDLPAEVIIVDNASSDQTGELLARVDGATIIQNSENLHFLRAVNQAAPQGTGKYILLLNNDTSLKAGPISAARDVLDEDAMIGGVGGKIVLLDGTLQEAGSIIWQDGSCLGYGRGRNPNEPEFQFRRDVDYCSGTFLMLRRDLFERLGWLNEQFAPAYYEETDLCMRIRAAGYRIVYEPRVEISHFEFGSSASSEAAVALQQRNHATFKELHQRQLDAEHLPHGTPPLEARMRSPARRILIIDDQVPYPELGSGFPRAAEIMRTIHAAGWFITFYPSTFPLVSWERAYALLPRDIEIMADHGEQGLTGFLGDRIDYYDAVLVSRPHNMKILHEACRQVPEFLEHTRLIYDAEAIFMAREALRVMLKSRPFTEDEHREKLTDEMALTRGARAIIAVSEQEAEIFRTNLQPSIHVIGHRLSPNPTQKRFENRADFLFVGALNGSQDLSPNVDALAWFVREVMPLLNEHLGDSYKLLVAGANESDDVRTLARPQVEFLGVVPNLAPVYDRARVFIAPTRFAAGIPHKVHEASAAGVPVVATPLLANQLGRSDCVDLLVADTAPAFADACYRLYTDQLLWTSIRESALARVAHECDALRFAKSVSDVLAEVPPLKARATANERA